MMGPLQQREPKLFYSGVNLDERIPRDHLLRRIQSALDLSCVRAEVAEFYGYKGQESVDPIVLVKLMLLLFLENVSSERALAEQLAFRLDWMWFCGLDLDDRIPNHSVLSKARRRWGLDVFTSLFERVLQQCVDAGLVGGDVLHVDGSCIDGAVDKTRLQAVLRWHGEALYDQLEETSEPVHPASRLTAASDPEAGVTRKNGKTVCGYKDHRGVDDAAGIITATVTTDAATDEGQKLPEVLAQHERNTGQAPETVVADKQYGTAENYRHLRGEGIQACIARGHRGSQKGKFGHDAFRYVPERDCFVCPGGQELHPYHRDASRRRRRYRAGKGVCAGCPLRAQCTDSERGRRVERHMDQEYLDWGAGCVPEARRRRLFRRRAIRAEGSFADGANRHGFKRGRWRGLVRMTIQNLLVATCQNLRKLLKATRRGAMGGSRAVGSQALCVLGGFSGVREWLYRALGALEGVEGPLRPISALQSPDR
jgi:IS5 family transposase